MAAPDGRAESLSRELETFRLGDEAVPRIVVGCWQLADDHRSGARPDPGPALMAAARAGSTTFDCADIYTGVEERLGAFRVAWDSDPTRLRFHTKLVPDLGRLARFGAAEAGEIVDRSRRRLGVDVLDLVQFHWWDFGVPGWLEVAGALADLRRRGRIRHVGVTNFPADRLRELLEAGVPVVANQVQYSLLDRRPETGTVALCREWGVALIAYGTLAGGFLSEGWRGMPDPGPDPGNRSLVKYRLIVEEVGGWEALQRLLDLLAPIAARHGTSIAAVATRWVLDRDGVGAVLVGLSTPERMAAWPRVLDLRLETRDRAGLERWLRDHPGPVGDVFGLERIPGGRHSAILKTNLQG